MDGFKILELDLPEDFKDSSFDGLWIFKYEYRNVLILWRKCDILILKSTVPNVIVGHFQVLSLDHTVKVVFQHERNLYCFTSNGTLYKLQECGKMTVTGLSSPQNIFDSSSDEDDMFSEQDCATFTLKEVARIPGCMTIQPLSYGFISVVEHAGILFVESFKIIASLDKIEKVNSVMLCHRSIEVPSFVMTTCTPEDMSPNLMKILLQDVSLLNADIVFLGLGSGQVYCVPVLSQYGTVCLPKCIYNSALPVSGVMCTADSTFARYSQINIILATGPVVSISFDRDHQELNYDTLFLPSSVHAVCQAGLNILASDGIDLWQCQVQRSREEEELFINTTVVGVKGVHLLCAIIGTDQAVASTFHGSFYLLCTSKEQISVSDTVEQYHLPSTSVSLNEQFQKFASLQKQIAYQDELTRGISVAQRAKLLRNAFTTLVEVWDWKVAAATTHFDQHTLLSLNETDVIGESHKKTSLQDTYLLKIDIENMSDEDFSPSLWSVHISVRKDGVATMKTIKLISPFTKEMPFHTVMMAEILNPTSCVEITCSLVFEIPSDEDVPLTLNGGSPWVILRIASTVLDATYFFTPFLGIYEGDTSSDGLYADYKTLLTMAQENRGNSTMLSNMQAPGQLGTKKKEYTYSLNIPDDVKHRIWSAVLRNSWHRCSKEVQTWIQSDKIGVDVNQSLTFTVGQHHVIMTLTGSDVHLRCLDSVTLHLVKDELISAVGTTSKIFEVTMGSVVMKRALDLEARIQIEKPKRNRQTFQIFKKEWRKILYDVPL